jgi:hypothetical protein
VLILICGGQPSGLFGHWLIDIWLFAFCRLLLFWLAHLVGTPCADQNLMFFENSFLYVIKKVLY